MKPQTIRVIAVTVTVAGSLALGAYWGFRFGYKAGSPQVKVTWTPLPTIEELARSQTNLNVKGNLLVVAGAQAAGLDRELAAVLMEFARRTLKHAKDDTEL